MGNKKLGRPTDNPKNKIIKIRADEATVEKLEQCSKQLNISRSEIVRKGIHDIYMRLNDK